MEVKSESRENVDEWDCDELHAERKVYVVKVPEFASRKWREEMQARDRRHEHLMNVDDELVGPGTGGSGGTLYDDDHVAKVEHTAEHGGPADDGVARDEKGQRAWGRLVVGTDPLTGGEEVKLFLNDKTFSETIPTLIPITSARPALLFSHERTNRDTSMVGRADKWFQMKAIEGSHKYRAIMKAREAKHSHRLVTKRMSRRETRAQRVRPLFGNQTIEEKERDSSGNWVRKQRSDLAVRISEDELKTRLFECFEKQPHWKIQELNLVVKQPANYLKEVLRTIAEMHTRGPLKNVWSLREEFRDEEEEDAAAL